MNPESPNDPLAEYAAQVADLQSVTAADFDWPAELAELDAVESVDDCLWHWAKSAHPSNGGEVA